MVKTMAGERRLNLNLTGVKDGEDDGGRVGGVGGGGG